MKSKIRLLSLVVSSTLVLLILGAMLVVLGIFNEALNWDLFGPKLQACLYGIFASCMALAAFGVAMTGIIAIQESVRDFKAFVQSHTDQKPVPDAPKAAYAARMLYILLLMAALVGTCAIANHIVLSQRCRVFKRLAAEQVGNFEPKIVGLVDTFKSPPQRDVPKDLYDIVKAIDNLDFVARTTLYVADPKEPTAMWGFTAWRDCYSNADGFARFYVAKDFEKAMRKAVDGDPADLQGINARNEFTWYKNLAGVDNKPRAVIRIDGNSRESFREYRLGE